MKFARSLWVILTAFFVTGCTGVDIQDYKNSQPRLTIEEYFSGNTKAWGVFQDRMGKVRRQFEVDINGTWNEEAQNLTLVEDFLYNDGATEQRIWTIQKTPEGTYKGIAAGVVGEAIGVSSGNAFNFKYMFDLPVDGKTWRVRFDDWMYLQNPSVLFNKASIYYWGIRIGDVYIFFDKTP
jgi:hypothetical protein